MTRLAVVAALASCLSFAACDDGAAALAPDAHPGETVDGRWRITRTVRQQPAGCRELHPADLTVVFNVGAATPISVEDGGDFRPSSGFTVTDTTAHFVTEDYAFPGETTRPVLISHDLTWLNSILLGTGGAQGDGDDLGCSWSIELTGIQQP